MRKTTTKPKSKAHILVIDDEAAILQALSLFLEQAGYQVETANKYDGYLKGQSASQLPNLIILDILLLDRDGRDIARELKSDNKTKHIPIVMISAHQKAAGLSKRVGADAFLAKPFEIKDLFTTIDRLLVSS